MFTGIVEELGSVVAIERTGDSARFGFRGPVVVADTTHGASIAVNGVCLTVVDHDADSFTADVMAESLARTSLGGLTIGAPVNLERALAVSDRLGGHIVQGHVDGVGVISDVRPAEHWTVLRVSIPADLSRYVVEKGSITVDGVSLTVSAVTPIDAVEPWFEVSLIPTTLALTTLGRRSVGAPVNLEVDVLAKYVERLTSRSSS